MALDKADQNNFDAADVQKLEAQYDAFKQMLVQKYNQLPAKLT